MAKKVPGIDFNAVVDEMTGETNQMTDAVIEKINENADETKTAKPDEFVPYTDSKLRFDLLTGESKERLKSSIAEYGILDPVLCIPDKGNRKIILSGHNRVAIAKELNIDVPYRLLHNISEEQQKIIVIDSNILNRQINQVKPSQLAYALNIRFSTMQDTAEEVISNFTQELGLTQSMIYRYKRLNALNKSILDQLDEKTLTLKIGYELSFLQPDLQDYVADKIHNGTKLKETEIKEIRKALDGNSSLSTTDLKNIIDRKIEELKKPRKTQVDYRKIRKYIPEGTQNEEQFIIEALEFYVKHKTENSVN